MTPSPTPAALSLLEIEQAQLSLQKGGTTPAEKVFLDILTRGKQQAAFGAFQLAEILSARYRYWAAHEYYLEAVRLDPDNDTYRAKLKEPQ